ncbi:PC4 domain-containing protein [Trichonephila clavipes]|uniref:PC4 domain-containing protein n=1 Tax=Trichonephila clavipes TaxID=2585209 RepID=A0A8X6T5D0_TRICX|nr:PC4 domain-containing protein [Trichonephila clavipes]
MRSKTVLITREKVSTRRYQQILLTKSFSKHLPRGGTIPGSESLEYSSQLLHRMRPLSSNWGTDGNLKGQNQENRRDGRENHFLIGNALLCSVNHETCYTSRLLHPRAKRVCFDKDNGKTSSFKPDAVPENHFHLGSHNYAVVSYFADVARIHLRRYKLDATGSLLPTKDGITVTPSVWLALVREFSAIDQAFEDGKVFVIKDCLLLSRTVIENVTHIIIQRYFQRKDFTRKFLTQFPC